MNFYTISVQRWPLPFYKTYRIVDHFWSESETRLTLLMFDGTMVSIPRMDRRKTKIYSNYRAFQEAKQRAALQPEVANGSVGV